MLSTLQKELIYTKWLPTIDRAWPILPSAAGRSKFAVDDNDLAKIHDSINLISRIAITEFIKLYGETSPKRSYIPYVWKAKLILYKLITGESSHLIPTISYTSFRRIEREFWDAGDVIDNWSKEWMGKLSTPHIRLLMARIKNPDSFKMITMLVDGKDFIITLNELKSEKRRTKNNISTLISHKNNYKNGGKVIFLDDIAMNPIAISRMVGCNEAYDGHLFRSIKPYKYIDPECDSVIFDHHFDSEVDNIIEEANEKGIMLSLKNFCPSIRKKSGTKLAGDEAEYIKLHGSFRSKHETERMNIAHTFKGITSGKKLSFDIALRQIKVAMILQSISRMSIEKTEWFDSVYVCWEDASFDFPSEDIPDSSPSVITIKNNILEMEKSQDNVINKLLEEDEGEIDDDMDKLSEDEDEYLPNNVTEVEFNPFASILRQIGEEKSRGRKKSARYIDFKKKIKKHRKNRKKNKL